MAKKQHGRGRDPKKPNPIKPGLTELVAACKDGFIAQIGTPKGKEALNRHRENLERVFPAESASRIINSLKNGNIFFTPINSKIRLEALVFPEHFFSSDELNKIHSIYPDLTLLSVNEFKAMIYTNPHLKQLFINAFSSRN
ncbi:MAG: hypothetical protein NUV67_05850 [archaeon]|nr:hypothetical protein [archaeon]